MRDISELPQMTKQIRVIAGLVLLFVLSACEISSGVKEEPVGIAIASSSQLIWALGDTIQLKAFALDKNGNESSTQYSYTWSSSNSTVASVDQNGLVTGHALGDTYVTVTGGGYESSLQIIVDTDVSTISVTVRYEDKLYNDTGFYQNAYKPARFVTVDAVNENDVVLSSTQTDASGVVSLIVPNSSSIGIRTLAKVATTTMALEVRDFSNNQYSVYKDIGVLSGQTSFAVDIPASLAVTGAFNILDVFVLSGQFVNNFNASQSIDLKAFWAPEDNTLGTSYFCNGSDGGACWMGRGIYVLSQPAGSGGDTDEFDDDVLMHEYGHFIADLVSRDDSPGGCHDFAWNDLDLRLAWSEGWGNYYPMAVKSWARASGTLSGSVSASVINDSYYIDTVNNLSSLYFDVSQLESTQISGGETLSQIHVHASSELAVTKILWRLQENFTVDQVWNVFDTYLPGLTGYTRVNMESFWDGWVTQNTPSTADMDTLKLIFNERQIYYQADAYETNDTIAQAGSIGLNETQTHYLYAGAEFNDIDFMQFNVVSGQTYTVETLNLTGGADTFLKVVNASGDLVNIGGASLFNDDYQDTYYQDTGCGVRAVNNGNSLASKLTFTAESNATYYISVSSVALEDPPVWNEAGRYGTYDVRVTQ